MCWDLETMRPGWLEKQSCKQIIKMQWNGGSKSCMSRLPARPRGVRNQFGLWDKRK